MGAHYKTKAFEQAVKQKSRGTKVGDIGGDSELVCLGPDEGRGGEGRLRKYHMVCLEPSGLAANFL